MIWLVIMMCLFKAKTKRESACLFEKSADYSFLTFNGQVIIVLAQYFFCKINPDSISWFLSY